MLKIDDKKLCWGQQFVVEYTVKHCHSTDCVSDRWMSREREMRRCRDVNRIVPVAVQLSNALSSIVIRPGGRQAQEQIEQG
jgi:hypothetical protein